MIIHANEKFTLDGNVLYYNTEIASKEENREINWDDVDSFKKILSENPQIKSVYITSWGGQIDAAIEIGDIIIDYELNTHAVEICFSACPLAFLGGEKRTLQRGDKIGFHQGTWDAASIEEYYDDKETQEYYKEMLKEFKEKHKIEFGELKVNENDYRKYHLIDNNLKDDDKQKRMYYKLKNTELNNKLDELCDINDSAKYCHTKDYNKVCKLDAYNNEITDAYNTNIFYNDQCMKTVSFINKLPYT